MLRYITFCSSSFVSHLLCLWHVVYINSIGSCSYPQTKKVFNYNSSYPSQHKCLTCFGRRSRKSMSNPPYWTLCSPDLEPEYLNPHPSFSHLYGAYGPSTAQRVWRPTYEDLLVSSKLPQAVKEKLDLDAFIRLQERLAWNLYTPQLVDPRILYFKCPIEEQGPRSMFNYIPRSMFDYIYWQSLADKLDGESSDTLSSAEDADEESRSRTASPDPSQIPEAVSPAAEPTQSRDSQPDITPTAKKRRTAAKVKGRSSMKRSEERRVG